MTETNIRKSISTLEVNPKLMLGYYADKIEETKKILSDFKSKYSFLLKNIKNNTPLEITELNMQIANIKWRSEIRCCITPEEGSNIFYLATASQIASCIAYRNDIKIITRDIKTKISATLSLMFKEGEIGRYDDKNGADYLYGIHSFFEEVKKGELITTLKKEYKARLKELEDYK